jgi:Lrp/AsnC family leucine-responsive transcriptional regulator
VKLPNGDPAALAILRELASDARMSMRQLSAAIGLSPPSTTDRVRRLEDVGVIRGYKAVLDSASLGWDVGAFVSLTARDGRCDLLLDRLRKIPNITAAYHVAGEVDYLVRIAARSLAELKSVTDQMADVGSVSSQIVLGTAFERDPPYFETTA